MTRIPNRIGVDIGGTFTDIALSHAGGLSSCKVLTDHEKPEEAILAGMRKAVAAAGITLTDIGQIIHGTTLVTNALIERRGARLAFITTEGFRDVIEMRAENRFEQYDLNLVLPEPLVPRQDRLTLAERIGPGGEVMRPLDPAKVKAMAERIIAGGYEAAAIGLMHAYANDSHERQMAKALADLAPNLPVSLSSVVSPQMRELPRFNTVIANAYVQPKVAAYLHRMTDRLAKAGVTAPVFMLHSGGGLIDVDLAASQPVRLLESGPAGGAIYAAGFARAHGVARALSFDMGGTTAKICLIEGGAPKTANSFEVARSYRFKKGSGMTVSTPVVEMVEIGAGGGSIAGVDRLGRLMVGPRSAGSAPGPAAYGRGGEAPTVTDANLLLGRLDPDRFAGGEIPLSVSAAEAAIQADLGQPLGLDPVAAALGVVEVVDENMANAARVHAVENGRDITDFTMIGFGGGAPLHACRLCEKLGLGRLIIPPGAGVGSAIGFLQAPFSYTATRGLFQPLAQFDHDAVNGMLAALNDEAQRFVATGAGDVPREAALTAQMRYRGQGWEIPVPLPAGPFAPGDVAAIHSAFEAAYAAFFGRVIDGLAVEITNWALTVATHQPALKPLELCAAKTAAPEGRTRGLHEAGSKGALTAREVPRSAMVAGVFVDGPAVITEAETTTIVTSAFRAIGQADGSLLLARKDGGGS